MDSQTTERDSERDSIFRLRERTRWLDSVREESSLRIDRTDGLSAIAEANKKSQQNPLNFGEEITYWCDKVVVHLVLSFVSIILFLCIIIHDSITLTIMCL